MDVWELGKKMRQSRPEGRDLRDDDLQQYQGYLLRPLHAEEMLDASSAVAIVRQS